MAAPVCVEASVNAGLLTSSTGKEASNLRIEQNLQELFRNIVWQILHEENFVGREVFVGHLNDTTGGGGRNGSRSFARSSCSGSSYFVVK